MLPGKLLSSGCPVVAQAVPPSPLGPLPGLQGSTGSSSSRSSRPHRPVCLLATLLVLLLLLLEPVVAVCACSAAKVWLHQVAGISSRRHVRATALRARQCRITRHTTLGRAAVTRPALPGQ